MGLRFQRRVSVLPGVTLNLGKTGASVSVGRRGAHVTVGPRGVTAGAGLPGTGLSYRTKLRGNPAPRAGNAGGTSDLAKVLTVLALGAYFAWVFLH